MVVAHLVWGMSLVVVVCEWALGPGVGLAMAARLRRKVLLVVEVVAQQLPATEMDLDHWIRPVHACESICIH